MLLAGAHFCDGVKFLTPSAVDQIQVRPHLPIDLFPADAVRFANKRHKLLQVPTFVDYVLRTNLAVRIHKSCPFPTRKYLALIFGEEFVAVSALVEVVLVFFEQQLELLHK